MRKSGSHGISLNNRITKMNIQKIFDERLQNVSRLALMTAQEMIRDFRNTQYAAKKINKKREKAPDAEVVDTRVKAAIAYFNAHKGKNPARRGDPWNNWTRRAAMGVVPHLSVTSDEITLGLSHDVYYGAYLEYANGRKHAVLEPLVRKYFIIFYKNLKHAMAGGKF